MIHTKARSTTTPTTQQPRSHQQPGPRTTTQHYSIQNSSKPNRATTTTRSKESHLVQHCSGGEVGVLVAVAAGQVDGESPG